MENLLGPDASDELVEQRSADVQGTSETPPAFIWHTADDDVVTVEQSLRFASARGEHHVDVAGHVFPYGRHGLGLAEDNAVVSAWTSLYAQFLDEQGF